MKKSLFFLCCCLLLGLQSRAATYYLKPDGNDGLNGQSVANAWQNLSKFASIARAGDILIIKGGVYNGQFCSLTQDGYGPDGKGVKGSSGSDVVFRAADGEAPIFDGTDAPDNYLFYASHVNYQADPDIERTMRCSYLRFEGIVIRNYRRGGIGFDGPVSQDQADDYSSNDIFFDHITVKHCLVDRSGQKGFSFGGVSDILMEDCVSSRNGWDINYGSWSSNFNIFKCWGNNIILRRCIAFHGIDVSSNHTDGNGFIVDLSYNHTTVTFENCVSFSNGGTGFQFTSSANGRLINCSSYENSQESTYSQGPNGAKAGIGYYGSTATNNVVLKNTIVVQSTGNPVIRGYWTSSGWVSTNYNNADVTNNTITGESGYQNPLFNGPPKDLSLQSSSPMINAGASSGTSNGLFYDPSIIKSQTSGQQVSWWNLAPDFDYISSKGGLKNCIYNVAVVGTRDRGACEYTGSGGGNNNGGNNGGSSLMIYDDAMQNSWTSGGWDYALDLNNTSPVKNGSKSAKVNFTGGSSNYGAWQVSRSGGQSTSGYSAIKFWAYGPSGGINLQIVVYNGSNESGRKTITVSNGAWNEYTVNLSEVGSPSSISNIWIHSATGGTSSNFYIDDLRLNGAGSGNGSSLIYSDAMQNSWASGGWDYSLDLNNTSPVKNGSKSAKLNFTGSSNNWGAWQITRSSNLSTSGYSTLKFWGYGPSGGINVQVVVKVDGTEKGRKTVNISASAWNEYTINLSEVGSPTEIDEIWIHSATGGTSSIFYIDDLRLNGGSNFMESGSAELAALRLESGLKAAKLFVYPNPMLGNELNLLTPFTHDEAGEIGITDLQGRILVNSKIVLQPSMQVSLPPQLGKGLYFLVLKNQAGIRYTAKFIKN